MTSLSSTHPGCNGETHAEAFDVEAYVEKVRASEIDSCDRLRMRALDARACLLVAEAWLRGGGCPWVSMGVHFLAERIMTGKLVEVEDGE